MSLRFDNRLIRELPGDPEPGNFVRAVPGALWSAVAPTPVRAPRLLAHSTEMAQALGLSVAELAGDWLPALAGNATLPGMATYATRYGGHQFGHWAGQLGDGRAIYLGEAVTTSGRWELQLKGAGATPYARHADGRAVLRSSIREFICSEAMHHLGVPTTRALSLVSTGEDVVRDMFYDGRPRAEPGAVVCRIAPSFLRFGHFELPAAWGEAALLRQLVDFCIERDFPEIAGAEDRAGRWFAEVCRRTGELLAHWMRLGFVHGVMNTDNMSILGLTIDYGPYGWLDDFDPGWTPNTTDAEGRRYCFGRQPEIARWNLERLAIALRGLFDGDEPLADGLALYDATYNHAIAAHYAAKLGLSAWQPGEPPRLDQLFDLLYRCELDMTDFFRRLSAADASAPTETLAAMLRPASYRPDLWDAHAEGWRDWLAAWTQKVGAGGTGPEAQNQRQTAMLAVNPRFVPRNYLAQQAIDRASAGDAAAVDELLAVLRQPYQEQPGKAAFAAPRPDWARHAPGCSMLSCSS